MGRGWLALGALFSALGIASSAFGAHLLADRLDARALELWGLSARYFLYGGFGLALLGITAFQHSSRHFDGAALSLAVGTTLFSGTIAALALGAPRWLGAVTPLGGTLLIVGFLLFAWQAMRGS